MAKQVKQFVYYGNENMNEITNMNIVQLGVQGLPGTKFYLNGGSNPIIIGNSGIYEINVEGMGVITSIAIDDDSKELYDNNGTACLIIDIIYEELDSN